MSKVPLLKQVAQALSDEVLYGDAVNFRDDEVDVEKLARIAVHAMIDSGAVPLTLMMHQLSVDEQLCTCTEAVHGKLYAHQSGVVYDEMLRED